MKYGICKVLCANIMKSPGHKGELHTQLLYGDRVEVMEDTATQWILIRSAGGRLSGWALRSQFEVCSKAEFDHEPDFISVGNGPGKIHGGILVKDGNNETQPEGVWPLDRNSRITEESFSLLEPLLGAPYMWGGISHTGIDCSGLVRLFYRFYDLELPHHAASQMSYGTLVDFLEHVIPGDLAFFQREDGEVDHVGILLSPGEIIHASESNGCVAIDPIDVHGILNRNTAKRTHSLRIIKRLI